MIEHILLFFIALACRGFDLFTTWAVTPDLQKEGNPIVRWLKWRPTIALTLLQSFAVCFSRDLTVVLSLGSVFVGISNLGFRKSAYMQAFVSLLAGIVLTLPPLMWASVLFVVCDVVYRGFGFRK